MDIIHIIYKDSHTTVTVDFINLICKDMVPILSIKQTKINEYEAEVNKKTYLEIQRRKLQYKNPNWVVIAFKGNSINKFNMEKRIRYRICLSFLSYVYDYQEKEYDSLKEAQKAVYSLKQRKWVKRRYTGIEIHSFEEDSINGNRFFKIKFYSI